MGFSLTTSTEAIAAVAVTVIAADGTGSPEEQDVLNTQLANMGPFATLGAEEVATLVGSVTDKVFSSLPLTGSGSLTLESVESVFSSAAALLDTETRKQTITLATTIADAAFSLEFSNAQATESDVLRSLRNAFER